MQWITAFLAFAVTMLVFAMVTSALVESIHRVLALRTTGLKVIFENIFDKVVKPHLSGVTTARAGGTALPAPVTPDSAEAKAAFVEHMMQNRATALGSDTGASKWRRGITALIDRFTQRFFGITDVPVEVFTQKLADPRFAWKSGTPSNDVVTDIAQKYEAFGREASVYFESRARLLSVIVAIPVAWLFFVHPYKLAMVYTKNPEVARAVADQAAKISADYEALRQRVTSDPKAASDIKGAIEGLKKDFRDADARSKELAAAGVPLGWPSSDDDVALCNGDPQPDVAKTPFVGACKMAFGKATWTVPTCAGAIWLTLGGLLVGLGAPFWARAVSGLTAARSGSWQRFAEIVGAPNGGAPPATNGAGTPSPRQVSNLTFAVSHRAANPVDVPP